MKPKYDHTDYIGGLASELTATRGEGHFYGAKDAQGGLTIFEHLRDLVYPCLIADDEPAIRWVDSGGDGLMERRIYTVYALAQADPVDAGSVFRARQEAEGIARQIAARVLHDFNHGTYPPLRYLERGSLQLESLGPLAEWAWGLSLSYTLLEPNGAFLDREQWV